MSGFGRFVFGVFRLLGPMLRAGFGRRIRAMPGPGGPMGFMELLGAVGALEFLAFAGNE